MDYFNDVCTTFLRLEHVFALLPVEGLKALGFNQNDLNLCSEDERRSYRFGTTWESVIIFIFRWTIPLILYLLQTFGCVTKFAQKY